MGSWDDTGQGQQPSATHYCVWKEQGILTPAPWAPLGGQVRGRPEMFALEPSDSCESPRIRGLEGSLVCRLKAEPSAVGAEHLGFQLRAGQWSQPSSVYRTQTYVLCTPERRVH